MRRGYLHTRNRLSRDRAIELRVVLDSRGMRYLHGLQSVMQRYLGVTGKRLLKIAKESNAAHRRTVTLPEGAVAGAPGRVVGVDISVLNSWNQKGSVKNGRMTASDTASIRLTMLSFLGRPPLVTSFW